jgi:hypothetical protein
MQQPTCAQGMERIYFSGESGVDSSNQCTCEAQSTDLGGLNGGHSTVVLVTFATRHRSNRDRGSFSLTDSADQRNGLLLRWYVVVVVVTTRDVLTSQQILCMFTWI